MKESFESYLSRLKERRDKDIIDTPMNILNHI
jgi:hypothetical protein